MTISTLPDVSRETIGSVETKENLDGFTPEDFDRKAHYVRRRLITDASVLGFELIALCGHRFVPTRSPEKFPVCERCKLIRDTLPPGDTDND